MQSDQTTAASQEPPFVITLTWLRRHGTKGAGWSRRQLEAIGLPYPVRAGWMLRMAGKRITQTQRTAFEDAAKTATGTSGPPRDPSQRAGIDDSAQLGSYVRAFAALARCDSRTNAFMLWLGNCVERLAAGTVTRAERQALVPEAARFVQALFAATAGEPQVTP